MATFNPTPAQKAAIETRDGAVLVSAAAGSGKTAVLVDRVLHRICDPNDPKNIDDFLIITFTEKAAAELRARLIAKISERLGQTPSDTHLQRQLHRCYVAQISTIDSFCADLCREYAYELDLPADFRMLEGKDRDLLRQRVLEKVLEEAYAEQADDPCWQALLALIATGRDDRRLPGYVQDVYDHAQCHLYPMNWLHDTVRTLRLEGCSDVGQTPWGKVLLARAKAAADRAASQMAAACDGIRADPVLQTKYLPVFEQDLAGLRRVQAAQTWDDVFAARFSFARLPGGRVNWPDPVLKDRAKAVRDRCKALTEAALEPFYGPSAEALEDLKRSGAALEGLFRLTETFSKRYDAEKQRLHLLDFGDLEHGAVRLLLHEDGTPTRTAKEISARYTELLLDEYQDTNEVQDLLFKAVSKDGQNRFMVGDVKQAIYGFRLADPGIFLKKYNTYLPWDAAGPGAPKKVLLSENFRSRPGVLEAANAVFSLCMSPAVGGLTYGEPERLRPGKAGLPDLGYSAAELHCIRNPRGTETQDAPEKRRTEAVFTAGRIRALLDAGTKVRDGETVRPCCPGDVVILLRSVKGAAHYYVEALAAQGIACVCETGSSIFDSEELEQLLSLLQVLDNAHRDIPLAATLLSPLFGFTPDELGRWCAGSRGSCLYETLRAKAPAEPKLAAFFACLDDLRTAAAALPLHSLLERIVETTDCEAVLSARPDGTARLANLRRFLGLAADYENGGQRSLRQFVAYLEGMKEQGLTSPVAVGKNAVTLLSVHKSKGLEFPIVVLPDLAKNFNMEDLRSPVLLHGSLGAGGNVLDEKHRISYPTVARKALIETLRGEMLSEELRVLYVAMTRAKDLLIMEYCDAYLESKFNRLAPLAAAPLPEEVAAGVSAAGDWVLLAALRRTEAGELFAVAEPAAPQVSDLPWVIRYYDIPLEAAAQTAAEPAATRPDLLPEVLTLPSAPGRNIPSKITATQLKGRPLDEEIADGAVAARRNVTFRAPSLLREGRELTPTERGVATHLAMQYLDFSKADSEAGVRAELERMVKQAFLTEEQAAAVRPETLLRVFEGPLGGLLRTADKVIREFKFSLLTDAAAWYPNAGTEKILLQGVTDCCLIKDGKLTVIDFKTDRFAPGAEEKTAAKYRGQLEAYSLALSRIFGLPVEKRCLYFFHTDKLVEI